MTAFCCTAAICVTVLIMFFYYMDVKYGENDEPEEVNNSEDDTDNHDIPTLDDLIASIYDREDDNND